MYTLACPSRLFLCRGKLAWVRIEWILESRQIPWQQFKFQAQDILRLSRPSWTNEQAFERIFPSRQLRRNILHFQIPPASRRPIRQATLRPADRRWNKWLEMQSNTLCCCASVNGLASVVCKKEGQQSHFWSLLFGLFAACLPHYISSSHRKHFFSKHGVSSIFLAWVTVSHRC